MAKQSFVQPAQLGEKVGVFGAMLTIVGTIIGGGIVGIPYATLQTGIWLVLIVHFLNFLMGIYSVHLLIEAKNISGLASFSELGFYCFGRTSIFIINALIVIAQCGMPIVYFMIIGDIGQGLLGKISGTDGTVWGSKQFPILVVALLLFYFAIKKEIQELKSAGFVLLSGVILFIIAMIILVLTKGTSDSYNFTVISKPKFSIKMVANIPTIFLAYGFQSAFFPAYSSLKNKTDANGMKATIASFTFCAVVYVAISIVALLKFGTELEGNVLNNVSHLDGWLSIVIDFVFLIIAMMHIPIVLFVGKEAFLIIIDEATRRSYSQKPRMTIDQAYNLRDSHVLRKDELDSEGKAYLNMNPLVFYGVSVGLYCVIVTAACLLKDITLVFGIIGSIAASYLIFLAPSQFYLRSIQLEEAEVPFGRKLAAWVFMILGFIIMFVCLFSTIYVAAKGE